MTGLMLSEEQRSAQKGMLDQAAAELQRHVQTECRQVFAKSDILRHWEQTHDLVGRVWVSVLEALLSGKISPQSKEHLKHIISLHVKWVTANVCRTLRQRPDVVPTEVLETTDDFTPLGSGFDWAAFHEAVTELPHEEQQVFECLWYDEMKRDEVAFKTGLTAIQVQRRYRAARERLMRQFPNF